MDMNNVTYTPVEFCGRTAYKVDGLIQRLEGPPPGFDMSKIPKIDPEEEARKARIAARWNFSMTGQYDNAALNAASQAINAERDRAVNAFYDGKMSGEDLSKKFQELLTRFRDACREEEYPDGWPLGMGLRSEEAMTEVFYSGFRAGALRIAVERNNAEGSKYITGKLEGGANWKYYNADYYYMSEDALAAIDSGLDQYLGARREEYPDFKIDIPDYVPKGLDMCYNFNAAWSAYAGTYNGQTIWRGHCDQFMRDYDQAPPKGFRWFYQSGGSDGVWAHELNNPRTHVPFDPRDPHSTTTWASYTDSKGTVHFIRADFAQYDREEDLRVVAPLLRFTKNAKEDPAFNRFLDNLQVCPKGYFLRHGMTKPLELWV